MPDSNGNFKGLGWSRKSEAAWNRAFRHLRDCDPELRQRYCNNSTETPRDQRCWPGEEGHKRLAHIESTTSSASTTRVASSSPSSKERRGES